MKFLKKNKMERVRHGLFVNDERREKIFTFDINELVYSETTIITGLAHYLLSEPGENNFQSLPVLA